MEDTSPENQERYFELLRQAGPRRRLEICLQLSQAVRELALAGIKQEAAGRTLSPQELRHALAARLYGQEVADRYFRRAG